MCLYVTVTKLPKYSHYEHVWITFFAVDRPKHIGHIIFYFSLYIAHMRMNIKHTQGKSVSVNLSLGHSYKACDQKSLFSVGLHRKG